MKRSALAVLSLVALGLLALAAGCSAPSTSEASLERGRDPWVFRSVLDWRPRMITLALRDSFYVAYDARRASLYKVWQDGVEFDGPVYTTAHGPQPLSLGNAYLISPYEQPWHVAQGSSTTQPEVQYRGHRFEDGQAVLQYALRLDDGTVIDMTETPEYVENSEGRPGLERVFTTENVPPGAEVALDLHLHSLPAEDAYETDGAFEPGPASSMTAAGADVFTRDGRLTLNTNGTTRFTAWFHPEPMVLEEAPTRTDEDKHPGLALIENSDCHACHNAEVKTVGPSYRAIAERYETTDATLSQLATKIIQGGTGNWTEETGTAMMTPHPDLQPADAEQMVRYILALDEEGTAEIEGGEEEIADPLADIGPGYPLFESAPDSSGGTGIAVNVYRYPGPLNEMPNPGPNEAPVYSGVLPALHLPTADDFGDLSEYFYIRAGGTIDIPRTTNYVFRLVSDDGAILHIDGNEIVNHDGLHGATPMDGEIYLEAGPHPFTLDYFQGSGGLALSLQWIEHGEEDFSVVPPEVFSYDPADLRETQPYEPPEPIIVGIPGDQQPLIDVHPSFRVETIRPEGFEPKVGGLAFLPDGRLVVTTWDPDGSVYLVSNYDADDRADIEVTRIAKGLLEPLGVTVVDGEIYVLQKHELTRLIDHDGDAEIDEYLAVSDDWGATSNFHEFAFGLVYEDGAFYATLATAILPGGASASPQNPDRGTVIKINRETGAVEFLASGLRTPNGIGPGVDGELFIADNQGDWLPASKIVHVEEGAWYGSRSVDPEGTSGMEPTPPVVWLPQNEIGNSPSQPAPLNVGPYQNQMVHGEVTHGGLKRVVAEEVDGQYQGVVFRFTQGLEAGVNRTIRGPDGHLYIGGIGNPGNWSHYGTNWYGLQRLVYTGDPVFEMLAVRAKANGLEIEFTEPLRPGDGHDPDAYLVKQWWYEPTANYGGPKMDEEELTVRSARISADRKKVFLEVDGMQPGHIVYVHLEEPWFSEGGRGLWTTEAWYTLNNIPQATGPSFTEMAEHTPVGPNALTQAERDAGWRLLFDGQSLDGWHAYGGGEPGDAWQIEDGALTLDGTRPDTAWQYTNGGDIVTDETFEDYELSLEWKIEPGGNSGLMYNVVEGDEYEYAWHTGPEMQILDDEGHADGLLTKHRAGDLYDLIASRFIATRPVGEWNHVRLIQRNGHVEHWLNGQKILEVQIGSPEWVGLVQNSKFSEMPAFGEATSGHLALQDHGSRVWFRNIKLRPL